MNGDVAEPLGSDEIWHHVNVLREQNNVCVHCEITHLIAHKSTALTKESCRPFTGRVDSTRESGPSPFPCQCGLLRCICMFPKVKT